MDPMCLFGGLVQLIVLIFCSLLSISLPRREHLISMIKFKGLRIKLYGKN